MGHEQLVRRAMKGTGPTVDFSGSWINEYKSTVKFEQKGQILSGKYESEKSADGTSTTGVVQGFVDGDLISFVVLWDKFQAITSWVGQLDETQTKLITLWQMTSQVATGDEWKSINAGSDTFTRQ